MSFHLTLDDARICVIGLGYVGLPLAVELSKKYPTIGFDLKQARIDELKGGQDSTGEVEPENLAKATNLTFSNDVTELQDCNVYIVAVPTPIDAAHRPNLAPLVSASRTVGEVISAGDVVIYESTVYPGATEEDCIPVVEDVSGLRFNQDFYAGYSPERINPSDKARPITKITKVTSGSTGEVADFVDALYSSVIPAGTFRAASIRVAEAAKIIENTQRDVNIALVNELSIVFSQMGIDTNEVIDAAATKWNFIQMRPGLVGGHCIGVDPYYLMHKAESSGHVPDIIRTAREINDGMARNAINRLIKTMIAKESTVKGGRALIVGLTFKENCPDTRNTKAVDLVKHLEGYGIEVDVVDSWASPEEVEEEYDLKIGTTLPSEGAYDAVILAVPHRDIVEQGPDTLKGLLNPNGVFFDVRATFDARDSDLRL